MAAKKKQVKAVAKKAGSARGAVKRSARAASAKVAKKAGSARGAVKRSAKAASAQRAAKAPRAGAKKVQAIPEGFGTVTAALIIRGAAEAIEFYKRAFGAKERSKMLDPSGKVMHAEIQIGDTVVMLGDEVPEMGAKSPQTIGGSAVSLMIYTENVDALFKRAVDAGATVTMPLADQFWGDRYGKVQDPFGHGWQLATHQEDVSDEEMGRRAAAEFAKFAAPQSGGQDVALNSPPAFA